MANEKRGIEDDYPTHNAHVDDDCSRVMKKRFLMDTGSEMGMAAIPMPINCCAEIGATFESDCDTRKK